MSTQPPDYQTLINTGRTLAEQNRTLPDNTPTITSIERELIQRGEQQVRTEQGKS